MRISRSTCYALIAAGYMAKHHQEGAILALKISKAYNIPLEYLLKILQQLVKAEVLRSKRGPRGGFYLARPPDQITLLDIIEAVDGPMVTSAHLAEQTQDEPFSVKMEDVCKEAAVKAKVVLESTRLSSVL
jgi:Rrf2 family protein